MSTGLVSCALLLTREDVHSEEPQGVPVLTPAHIWYDPTPDPTVKCSIPSNAENSYSFQLRTNLLAYHNLVLLSLASAAEHFNRFTWPYAYKAIYSQVFSFTSSSRICCCSNLCCGL